MLIVETIRKIRLSVHRDGKSLRKTAEDLNLSRNTVRKVIRSQETAFTYKRKKQPMPKLGSFVDTLAERLEGDKKLPKRQRRTAQKLFQELQLMGYEGGYDSVRRYVKRWRQMQSKATGQVFIPLSFDPGDAFQFDWSHECVQMAGMPVKAKVAHLRLCHSRMFLTVAYPRETQEMVFDAHEKAIAFFGGICRRGIYDNLKTVVNKILSGKQRSFNNRFGQLCSHYLFEPVACTPASGWEKGQVENQVGVVRRNFFTPRLKVRNFEELNAHLMECCISWAKTHRHPEIKEKTVWQVFKEEQPYLLKLPPSAFDGYAERPARVSPSSLVSFDHNRYSVDCRHTGKTVQMRVYAARILVVHDGEIVADHVREFGRGKTIFNPWHYLPALETKPGALRNGAPFKNWDLPEGIETIRDQLRRRYSDWDRQFVDILTAVPHFGVQAVHQACREALKTKTVSKEVVLNLLYRGEDNKPARDIDLGARLHLECQPVADCSRYDRLIKEVPHAAQ
jgi:transposase